MKYGLMATLLGGLVAGVLDIVYAFVIYGPLSYGATPMGILQSVAAGWMGRDAARAGEWITALYGLGTHFVLATIMAGIFVTAASVFRNLTKRAILWGLLYGLVLYVAMNYVVVPLSAAGANGHFAGSIGEVTTRLGEAFSEVRGASDDYPWMLWGTLFAHAVLVGLPIAMIAKKFAPQSA